MDAPKRKYRALLGSNGKPAIGRLHLGGYAWSADSSDRHIDRLFAISPKHGAQYFALAEPADEQPTTVVAENQPEQAAIEEQQDPPTRKPRKPTPTDNTTGADAIT